MFPLLPPTFKPVNNLSFLQDNFDAVNSSTTLFFSGFAAMLHDKLHACFFVARFTVPLKQLW